MNEVGRKLRGVHDGEEERVSWFMIVTEENKLLNAIGWEGLFPRSAGLDWRVVGGTMETSEQKDPSDPHDKDTVTTFADRAPDTHARHCGPLQNSQLYEFL